MVFERDIFIKSFPPGPPDFSVCKPPVSEMTYSLLPLWVNFPDAPFHPLFFAFPEELPKKVRMSLGEAGSHSSLGPHSQWGIFHLLQTSRSSMITRAARLSHSSLTEDRPSTLWRTCPLFHHFGLSAQGEVWEVGTTVQSASVADLILVLRGVSCGDQIQPVSTGI